MNAKDDRQSSSKPRRIASQLLSYGLVGLATNLAAYLVYLLLTFLAVDPKLAMTILYVLGATLGFFANRKITFRHQGRISTAGGRYCLAQGLGYFLNLSLLLVFVDWLGMPHQLVQAAAILIVAGLLFVLYRFYVFPVSAAKSEAIRS